MWPLSRMWHTLLFSRINDLNTLCSYFIFFKALKHKNGPRPPSSNNKGAVIGFLFLNSTKSAAVWRGDTLECFPCLGVHLSHYVTWLPGWHEAKRIMTESTTFSEQTKMATWVGLHPEAPSSKPALEALTTTGTETAEMPLRRRTAPNLSKPNNSDLIPFWKGDFESVYQQTFFRQVWLIHTPRLPFCPNHRNRVICFSVTLWKVVCLTPCRQTFSTQPGQSVMHVCGFLNKQGRYPPGHGLVFILIRTLSGSWKWLLTNLA